MMTQKKYILSKLVNNPFKEMRLKTVMALSVVFFHFWFLLLLNFFFFHYTAMTSFKGNVHQFWIYNIFFVSQQKKYFSWTVHHDKTTLTRNNCEKWCSKSVRVIYNTYNSTRLDWLWSLSLFSQLFRVWVISSR